jgi:hypothetical protein
MMLQAKVFAPMVHGDSKNLGELPIRIEDFDNSGGNRSEGGRKKSVGLEHWTKELFLYYFTVASL